MAVENEVQKTQEIRLWDVFVIGPFLMYVSANEGLKGWERSLLFVFSVGTIVYNGINYLEQDQQG